MNKVYIICTEHGEFEQTPHKHLNGRRCGVTKMNNNILPHTHNI